MGPDYKLLRVKKNILQSSRFPLFSEIPISNILAQGFTEIVGVGIKGDDYFCNEPGGSRRIY